MVGGISASTAALYASLRGASALFSITVMTPYARRMISMGNEMFLMLGIILCVFILVVVLAAECMHQATVRKLGFGLEKDAMLREQEQARLQTLQLNQDLLTEISDRRAAEQRIESSERELSRILDNMQDTYYCTDLEGKVRRVSASVEDLLGYRTHEIIGRPLSETYVDPQGRDKFLAAIQASNGRVRNYEAPLRRKDGAVVWVSTNAQYIRGADGEILGIEGTTRDISALKKTEQALFEEKEKAEVTLKSIGDGVITTDVDGCIDYMNPVAEALTGWPRREAQGRPLGEVLDLRSEESGRAIDQPVYICFGGMHEPLASGDLVMHSRHGQEYSVEITVSPLDTVDGDCKGTVMVFHDVTELRGLAREMSHQATHDSLTGLINRAEFERRLQTALKNAAADAATEHALMYLDLDQFKVVNDTCGHGAGDELLKKLTAVLKTRLRGSDVLARLGGDEFGVLLENCPIAKAEVIAEDLRDITEQFRFFWQNKVFEVGASIGLVPLTARSGDLAAVLSAADSACYVAKDLGRNRVHVFHTNDKEVAIRHGQMQWIQRIKEALKEDRLVLFCQKVCPVDPASTSEYYHEVLMRLVDERGELVPPAAFIPAAERYHLMAAIDRWVVGTALRYLGEDDVFDITDRDIVAINLSGQSLADELFLEFVKERFRSSGIAPQRICFEITETAAISNFTRAALFIAELRAMGCRFALDDFGSGLSSFAYLKQMPVDYLKIDGVFVRDIASDPVHYAIVQSINHIGHTFGVRTIAEFAEDELIIAKLRAIGVDYAQGFGVARPLPLQGGSLRAARAPTATRSGSRRA